VLKSLPRLFLGYGKLLVTIIHTDSFVINSESFKTINDQLRQNHVLVQGYGIRQSGELCYEAFPFEDIANKNERKVKYKNQRAVDKLSEVLNLRNVCGYITFVRTGVPDLGCDEYQMDVCLQRPKVKKPGKVISLNANERPNVLQNIPKDLSFHDLQSPIDSTEITSFNKNKTIIDASMTLLKSPDENYFASSPKSNASPSNVYRSADCNELLKNELEKLDQMDSLKLDDDEKLIPRNLASQSSIEIELVDEDEPQRTEEEKPEEYLGEVSCICALIACELATNYLLFTGMDNSRH